MKAMNSVFLQEMGIDIWRMRGTPAASDQAPAASSSQPAASSSQPAPRRRTAAPRRGRAESAQATAASAEAVTGSERRATVAPFTVLCLSKADAVLFVEPGRQRGARRFASDLLSATTGVWGGQTGQLEFRWPQAGIENAPEAVGRALGAFVSKQIVDLARGGVVLIGAEVADRLPPGVLPADALLLPPTERLMVDGGRKRALWQEIGRRLGEA
jgi:hypothetical protein